MQPSARIASHATHASAPCPQAARDGGAWQVAPEQQPPAHVPALQLSQMPPAQLPAPQSSHAPPPMPHAVSASPIRQTSPSQQPAQLAPSQMQLPPSQR